jgi:putative endonuclease
MKQYYVYTLANEGRMLYTGVTNDLMRRIFEHKNLLVEGYTKKYKITKLVYYDHTNDIYAAITREKQIKG